MNKKNTSLNEDLALLGLPALQEAKAAVQPEIYEIARIIIDTEYTGFQEDPLDYIRSLSWDLAKWHRIKEVADKIAFTKEDVDELARMLQKKKIIEIEAARDDDDVHDYAVNLVARDIQKLYPESEMAKNEADEGRRYHSVQHDLQRGRLKSPYELQAGDVGKELGHDFGQVMKQDVGKQVVYRNGIIQMENPEQMKKRKGIKEDQLAGWKAGQKKLAEARAEPLPGVSNVQSFLNINVNGNGYEASELYDYDRAVDNNGYFGITHLNVDKVIKFFEGKKIDVREFEKNILGGEFDSETFAKYRDIGDEHFIYSPDSDSESLMVIEKDEKYYLAIWANTVGFSPDGVCELSDEIDLRDYYGALATSATITFDLDGKSYAIDADGQGDINMVDDLPEGFTENLSDAQLWNALAAMQDNKPVQEAGEDELKERRGDIRGDEEQSRWKSGDRVFFDYQGLLRGGIIRFISEGVARVAMGGTSRITQIVMVPIDQLHATADEAKAGRQKRQDADRGLKTEVAAKTTVRYSRREWEESNCTLLDSEGKKVDSIDGAELLAEYCEEQGIEYDETEWDNGTAIVSLDGKEVDTVDVDTLVDAFMDDQGKYIMEGRLQKKRQVSLGEDGRMLGLFTPQMANVNQDNSKVIVYDNGGKTADRYTVFVGDSVYTMCDKPLSPQGFNQYAGNTGEIKQGVHLGKKVKISDLSDDVQAAIRQRANLSSVKMEDGGREKCPSCGLPGPAMPEDAKWDEKLCNSCYEKLEKGELKKPGATDEEIIAMFEKSGQLSEGFAPETFAQTMKEIDDHIAHGQPFGKIDFSRFAKKFYKVTDDIIDKAWHAYLKLQPGAAGETMVTLPESKKGKLTEGWWAEVQDKPETAELFKQAEKLAKTVDQKKYGHNKWVTKVGDLYVTTWWDVRSKNWITFAVTEADGYQEGDSDYTGNQTDAKASHYGMVKALEKKK